ncbi:hypothetical protein BT63DRAFT_116564 [Microthyrium microscopicum]|uniref:Uncharacterized protein n=1 Tax=Microthyrium microscopicum TaxID=703497 RepID=A0A6A6TVY3_9PEZI|nr:hypothetical protein BT63DRAFT_116564 [Microthyrium microscopicum]
MSYDPLYAKLSDVKSESDFHKRMTPHEGTPISPRADSAAGALGLVHALRRITLLQSADPVNLQFFGSPISATTSIQSLILSIQNSIITLLAENRWWVESNSLKNAGQAETRSAGRKGSSTLDLQAREACAKSRESAFKAGRDHAARTNLH